MKMRRFRVVVALGLTGLSLLGCRRVVEPTFFLWEGDLVGVGGSFDPFRGSAAAVSEGPRTAASIAIEGAEAGTRYIWRIRRGTCDAPRGVVGGLAAYPELVAGEGGGDTADTILSEAMPAGTSYHAVVILAEDESVAACGALHPR